jgi:squalene-hopene/tetraprenyl-beta-curcumene cyclase
VRYARASLLALATTATTFGGSAAQVPVSPAWDAQAAASYLDSRMSAWLEWPNAQRDHGTACVSCHTTLPYALARPSLRRALSETARATPEGVVYDQVTTRVRLWREVEPYYPDQTRGLPKTSESRGTEAVLNAVILAARDAEAGVMSDDLRLAFANLWALQMRREPFGGGWAWLEFGLEPWEGPRSSYVGAALAAIAIGTAPGGYAATPEIQDQLALLRQYLANGADGESLYNRLMILWASSELDGILEESQREAIVIATLGTQKSDGGWSLPALAPWQRIDDSTLGDASDGYATALAVIALQRAAGSEAAGAIERGRAWLAAHQDSETGSLPAVSINRNRDPATEPAKFMTDAATALASLALTEGR